MPLAPGTRLGPYEIVSAIGAGGMGEVFRARDTRLDRSVAIKILPAALADDAEWRGRFEREARAIAAVAHPHICTIHDVGLQDGVHFLVMELLDGQTLAARLASGPLPMPETLKYAIQIADALGHAHRRDILHRDLKPANIVLTAAGAKLLDFGLARHGVEAPRLDGATATTPLTGAGQILGTLQYMAPEQLEGKTADARTDIFAFGAILHEMATGSRTFEGQSQAAIIGAILHVVPPSLHDVPGVPPAFARLVRTCLAKAPADRWSSIDDVRLLLKSIADGETDGSPAVVTRGPGRVAFAAVALAALAASVLAAVLWRGSPAAPDLDREVSTMLPPEGVTLSNGDAPQISPDGRVVAFTGNDRSGTRTIYLRPRGSAEARSLPGTQEAAQLFWSPDSRSIGFFAQGYLKTIAIAGGAPQTIAPAPVPRGGTWSKAGFILFRAQPPTPPFRVPQGGGVPVPVPAASDADAPRWFPTMLPDGQHYLYLAIENGVMNRLKVGSVDSPDSTELAPAQSQAVYLPAGYLVYRREGALVAQPFDAQARRLTGAPRTIAESVGFNPVTYQAMFSASDTGVVAFRDASPGAELLWVDRSGKRLESAQPAAPFNLGCMSQASQRIVYESADPVSANVDLWLVNRIGDKPSRLTFNPSVEFYPICSPTADEVVFSSLREGRPNLFRLSIGAPGTEQPLLRSPLPKLPTDWSRHGPTLVFSLLHPDNNWDVMVLPLNGGDAVPFVATPAQEVHGKLSPDGRWMAYVSTEGGRAEVYVQPFPAARGKWQVSSGGGGQPQWRSDGRELYYVAPDRKLMMVAVSSGSSNFSFTPPQPLIETRITGWEPGGGGFQYAVSADGQRFLFNSATDAVRPVTLIRNWMAGLAR